MDQELKTHLDGLTVHMDALGTRMTTRFDGLESRVGALDTRFEKLETRVNRRFDESDSHVNARFDGLAKAIATEVGRLHEQIKDLDRRLLRVDGNTITTMELLTRQSRWHEQSDNAVRELTVRQGEFARKLNELRGEKQ